MFEKQKYLDALSSINPPPVVKVFRAGGGFLHPEKIVYDLHEEINLKPDARSARWWAGVVDVGEFKGCHYYTVPLGDHFFEVNFSH